MPKYHYMLVTSKAFSTNNLFIFIGKNLKGYYNEQSAGNQSKIIFY